MGLDGPRRLAKAARAAFYGTVFIATVLGSPDHSQAGKRNATDLASGLKIEDTIKPGIARKDSPKDDPKEP